MGTAMPRLLSSVGGMSLVTKTCSDEERALFTSPVTAEVGEIGNYHRGKKHGEKCGGKNVTLVRL